ncbi:hypothetical protein TWF696_002598 [Orbilia brochopaga]|uniref:Integral membrane protein n=1 Tax=Orbilia brochopaga TaxID=3140254 RepID=A0AAV9U2S9_9PEZI
MGEFFDRLGRSPILSPRNFQYACAASGILCAITFMLTFIAAGFWPPARPWWDAERTAKHYRDHETGIKAGSALIVLAGMFYLPFSVAISAQMRRIPKLHYIVSALQLAAGAAGIFVFMMPGAILAVANYRPGRSAEITEALNDLFWITVLLPWPTFLLQEFAFAYAILIDVRPKPLFPKAMAILNIVSPIIYVPAIAVHCVRSGIFAWNGVWNFWLAGVVFCIQLTLDALCLIRAIKTESEQGEKSVDSFPITLETMESGESAERG